jgi:hypothetical protein
MNVPPAPPSALGAQGRGSLLVSAAGSALSILGVGARLIIGAVNGIIAILET